MSESTQTNHVQQSDGSIVPKVALEVRTIPLEKIRADRKFNARQIKVSPEEYAAGIESLAASIGGHGKGAKLIELPVVRERDDKAGYYDLTAGFRRYDALMHLGILECDFHVFKGTLQEAYLVNLEENEQREPLKPHELAERCCLLRDEFKMSAAEIAKRIRRSKGHVNNLMRIRDVLAPSVYQDAFVTQAMVFDAKGVDGIQVTQVPIPVLCTIATKTADIKDMAARGREQKQLLEGYYASLNEEEGGEEEGGEGEGESNGEGGKVTRPLSRGKVEAFFAALKKTSEHSAAWREGAMAAMKYTMGKVKTCPIELPEPPKRGKKAAEGEESAT